jgi:hypothetical protein
MWLFWQFVCVSESTLEKSSYTIYNVYFLVCGKEASLSRSLKCCIVAAHNQRDICTNCMMCV